MRSNTTLLRVINNIQRALIEKGKTFKHHFIPSTFCLFFGFICGNLFGTFLNYFRIFIHWDGAIIALTLLFIEIINYFNFVILKRYCEKNDTTDRTFNQEIERLPLVLKRQKGNPQTFSQIPYIHGGTVNQMKYSPWFDRSGTIKSTFGLLIRFLNFFKIGLLLGFFIDAFKVGS